MTVLLTTASVFAGAGDVIPRPVNVKELPGEFTVNPAAGVEISDDSEGMRQTAQQLADLIGPPMGAVVPVITPAMNRSQPNAIRLVHKELDSPLGDEGYQLTVGSKGITIQAGTTTGLFYGVQTLRQLLPAEIEKREKVDGVKWVVPCCEIKDQPRYAWRGLMLDVSRHFQDKAEVEHFLDLMALYKFNRFHWHLTDDQGWRIEIKKYPKLTEIGAWRDGIGFHLDPKRTTHYRADGKYGGFYTQDDIREVVAYAEKLHIMVIPEIEMPGHSQAALTAYPEFGCDKQPQGVGTKAGVMDAIYDPGVDGTFTFLDDVLTEVAGLFPAPYIHIGGDEVPKGPWKKSADAQAVMKANGLKDENELQSYFIKRVEKIVESKNRKMIGWDEILEGGLAPGATVMSWRGIGGGIEAAKAGHDVIMTPTSNCYFDYSQTRTKGQPPTGGGFLPLKTVYAFEPTPKDLTPEQAKHVLGGQGNIWTEYIPDMKQVELMTYPRACAMAEVTWSPAEGKDFKDFVRRLDVQKKRLAVLGVNCFVETAKDPEPIGNWMPGQMSEKLVTLQWDAGKAVTKAGKYDVVMQYTGGACRLDIKYVALQADSVEIARDTHDGTTGGTDHKNNYELTVPEFKAGMKYTLIAEVRSDGGTDSNGTVSVTVVP
jgi:hexosaminidase